MVLESNVAIHEVCIGFLQIFNLALKLIYSCFINLLLRSVFPYGSLAIEKTFMAHFKLLVALQKLIYLVCEPLLVSLNPLDLLC